MDRLKQYIKENIDSFDTELPPEGSRERFMAALEGKGQTVKVRKFPWTWALLATSAAAVLVAVVTGLSFSGVDKEIERSILAMNNKEAEVIMFIEERLPHERESLMNSIRSITAEAIPFTELLPEELPAAERARLIKEYYGRKTEALDELMACYDNSRK